MPINSTLWGPQIDSILELIAPENLPPDQAKALAVRIIDYERNLQQEREAFSESFLGGAPAAPKHAKPQTLEHLDQYFAEPAFASERGLDAEERAEQRAYRAASRVLQRSLRRQIREDVNLEMRYHKRSSNQLIKALKALVHSVASE